MAQGSDGRRMAAFVAAVALLAGVGIYLTVWPGSGESREPVQVASSAPSLAQAEPTDPAPPATATTGSGDFDIYDYLPLTKDQVASAVDVARRFAESYATFRYDEDPASYAQRLKAFTTASLGDVLARSVTSPGAVQQNQADQVISDGSARVTTIRDVEKDSLVCVVTATQKITAKSGTQERSADYALTLVPVGDGWRVYDMQPADVGQDGDTSGAGNGEVK